MIKRRLLLPCLVVVMIGLAGCPTSTEHMVCLSCEAGIESAGATPEGVSVQSSQLEIYVYGNGSAQWHVRSELTESEIPGLQNDSTRVQRIAEQAVTAETEYEGRYGTTIGKSIHGGKVTDVSGEFRDRTVEITYTVEDMAVRGLGGVLLVDYFHAEGEEYQEYALGADRLTLTTEPDLTVIETPPTGEVSADGRSMIWNRETSYVPRESYVVFAPSSGLKSQLATTATLGINRAEWILPRAVGLWSMIAVILIGVVSYLTVRTADRLPAQTVGEGQSYRDRLFNPPPIGLCGVLGFTVLATVAVLAQIEVLVRTLIAVVGTFPVLPIGFLFLFGYTLERDRRLDRTIFASTLALLFLGILALFVDPSHSGSTPHYVFGRLPAVTILLLIFGIPAFYAGRFLHTRANTQANEQ